MSKNLSINKSNGNACYVTIGQRTWYFSYNTCVAFETHKPTGFQDKGYIIPTRIRRDQNYSVTTAKHMNTLGVKDWPKVDDATFEAIAELRDA